MFGNPHLVLVIPGVVRAPNFEANGIFAARLGHEDALGRMRNFRAGDDHDFFRDPLVDQNTVALAHGDAVFSFSPGAHGSTLPSSISSGNADCLEKGLQKFCAHLGKQTQVL